jgi:hypothetical protein
MTAWTRDELTKIGFRCLSAEPGRMETVTTRYVGPAGSPGCGRSYPRAPLIGFRSIEGEDATQRPGARFELT